MRSRHLIKITGFFICIAATAMAQPIRQVDDPVGDVQIRRIDHGGDGALDETIHTPPDILGYRIGRWAPTNPFTNRYVGAWANSGGFVRIDIWFAGRVNPPGPLAQNADDYAPYLYGDHPVFGYFELDVDQRVDTGGEIAFPHLRYLAAVARFGGKPTQPRFADRVPLVPEDFDGNVYTPPYYERSGEEFHIALFGDKVTEIVEVTGNNDARFDSGERWIVRGRLFHRAHAFETISAAGGDGVYEPVTQLAFEHDPTEDRTTITLVFPLTNTAAAQLGSNSVEPIQPMDGNDNNQASIEEALKDLVDTANNVVLGSPVVNDPSYPFLQHWRLSNPADYLNPHLWDVTFVAGMAYTQQQGPGDLYAFTDVIDDPIIGDFNGDGRADCTDEEMLAAYIEQREGDGLTNPEDGAADGVAHVADFARRFSVFDLDYDGAVGPADAAYMILMGDLDLDCDVDADDVALFVQLLTAPDAYSTDDLIFLTLRADFVKDGVLDGADLPGFVHRVLAE